MDSPGGASATQEPVAATSKNTAPVSRTARSTSDKTSIGPSADDRARPPDAKSFPPGQRFSRLAGSRREKPDSTRRTVMTSTLQSAPDRRAETANTPDLVAIKARQQATW